MESQKVGAGHGVHDWGGRWRPRVPVVGRHATRLSPNAKRWDGISTTQNDEGAGRGLCNGILKAQARLGHRDPVTTLRHYAHATPLDDLDVADRIDDLLNAAIG